MPNVTVTPPAVIQVKVGATPNPTVQSVSTSPTTLRSLTDVDSHYLVDGYALEYNAANNNFRFAAVSSGNVDRLINSANAQALLDTSNNFIVPGDIILSNDTRLYVTNYATELTANVHNDLTGIYMENPGRASGLLALYSNDQILFVTDFGNGYGGNTWTLQRDGSTVFPGGLNFNANGTITFPDTTIQTTAFTGTAIDQSARAIANSAGANTVYLFGISDNQNNSISYISGVDAYQNIAIGLANTLAQSATSLATTTGANTVYLQTNLNTANANISYILATNLLQNNNIGLANTLAQSAFALAATKFANTGGTITGPVTINSDLSVSGTLYLTGNAYTVSANNNLVVNSAIIYLAANNPANLLDIGVVGHFVTDHYQHTGLIRDHSDGKWKFFSNVSTEPTTTINFGEANTVYDTVKVGTIESAIANIDLYNAINTPSVTATTTDLTLSAISTGAVKFSTLGGLQAQVTDTTGTNRYISMSGGVSGSSSPSIGAFGGTGLDIYATGGSPLNFWTNGVVNTRQLSIAHTASAVNYVQVTGAATGTGNSPTISAQGSDADINLTLAQKGAGSIRLQTTGINRFTIDSSGTNRLGLSSSGGTAFQVAATGSQVNFFSTTGTIANIVPSLSAQGTDTNISMAFQPKGTGAIDLAAGSSGVNISNGGTVTAVTRTATGSVYTSSPTWSASAPTTAGGVTATGATTIGFIGASTSISNGGTGYTVGDVLTVVGGTFTTACQITVTTVSSGVITGISISNAGAYTVAPTSPVSITGGTGSGATFAHTGLGVITITIGNAGSGYIEQPTVTFSGGGGSGASAYATVGGTTILRSIGASGSTQFFDFYTPQSITAGIPALRLRDNVADSFPTFISSAGGTNLAASSSAILYLSGGTSSRVSIGTNGTSQIEQMRVSHTASAVNYVQVTGAATTGFSTISAQGSDANTGLYFQAKGTGSIRFSTAGANSNEQFRINNTATAVNYMQVTGNIAGSAPSFSVAGTDTNIDLALIPKGTGVTTFGSQQANYWTKSSASTTLTPITSVVGSDTNISMAFQPKGTGAIDLAAGSSGVNISNGGTVTAITRTSTGSGYSSFPTIAISAPTTAGGVQATASVFTVGTTSATIQSGGTGYTVNDVISTNAGASQSSAATFTVTAVSSGVITAISSTGTGGAFTAIPTNPVATTGGSGSGATLNISSFYVIGLSLLTAGSGYIEQPTVTFSGGGGSGAAAFASVGTTPFIKGLASTLQFSTNMGSALDLTNYGANQATNRYALFASATGNPAIIEPRGDTNVNAVLSSRGTGSVQFYTNGFSGGTGSAEQLRVSHTASAVNYVQVTGAATTQSPVISTQGSDTDIKMTLRSKGNAGVTFQNSSLNTLFDIPNVFPAANYLQANASVTGNTVSLKAIGTDTNISMALQPTGTGAIDLAAGSSGVNISNGGTVTALTKTAGGSGYTTTPSVSISAPTTAGGVQATANATYNLFGTSLVSGGTGYTVGDILTFVGGTFTDVLQYTVTSVSGGVITGTSVLTASFGIYSVLPPSTPATVTGGTGSGATFNLTWTLRGVTVNNAGSGYIEQPTVTFSGGGGSGASAYATVGSDAVVKTLGTNMAFYTPNGRIGFRVVDLSGGTGTGYWSALGGTTSPQLRATGAGSAVILTESGVSISLQTASTQQFVISHTASAVNYVQVTGGITGSQATISAQGSDANVGLIYTSKGTSSLQFRTNNSSQTQLFITHTANAVNYASITGSAAGAAPAFSVAGTDTNIDLALTPKGTGRVTTSATLVAGLISGGTF